MEKDAIIIAKRAHKVIYRVGDKIIKTFDEDYSKADILNEALNQARVEQIGINIPKLIEVCKIDGKWSIVMEYIEGKTLEQLMQENPEKTDEYLDRFIRLQMLIHTKRSKLLTLHRDKMYRKIDSGILDASTKYDLHVKIDGMPKHEKVLHGDFNPSNVIITPDDKEYVIDWAHVTQGSASADCARTFLIFSLAQKDELANKYLKRFCQLNNIAIQYVQKWIPIVAASQLAKQRPEEKEFLMKWIDVFDFQ